MNYFKFLTLFTNSILHKVDFTEIKFIEKKILTLADFFMIFVEISSYIACKKM